MAQITLIPKEMLALIPKFEGDEHMLNLFIKKCEYVKLAYEVPNNMAQNLYVFHTITSRLTGRAASLLSEREDVTTWESLKDLLVQHFGDPRSEECVAIELETMKIKHNESYIDFCHRIQSTRSTLFAKVNRLTDEGVKAAKMIIYNNTSLNVFLYNMPEDMIRIIRLKNCTTLELALAVVMEETNFQQQYNAKNKAKFNNNNQHGKPQVPQNSQNTFGQPNPSQNFKFGFPQKQGFNYPTYPQQGFRNPFPHAGFRPQNFPNQQNFKYNAFAQPNNFKFGIPSNPQGNFRFGIPQQAMMQRPNNNFNNSYPQNFKFGIPNTNPQQRPFYTQPPQLQTADVSMRTAPPLRQNMVEVPENYENAFYNNELELNDQYYLGIETNELYLNEEAVPTFPECMSSPPGFETNYQNANTEAPADSNANFCLARTKKSEK